MISRRIINFLLHNRTLNSRHLGFMPLRDSQTTVMMLHQDITLAKKKKKFILGIALDLKVAYD